MTRGYLTFVQNGNTDYLKLAYAQAMSIKATQKINSYAVVVDSATQSLITDQHRKVFDYIITMPEGDDAANDSWKLRNEWKAYLATPFDETFKVEADMLLTSSVDHWWDIVSIKDICFTTDIVNYKGKVSNIRVYRKIFDTNNLLNVYNGFFYFKKSNLAQQFFEYAKYITKEWEYVTSTMLVDAENQTFNTDLMYAVACRMIGDENCYLPNINVPTFTHMKGAINNWTADADWKEMLYYQFDRSTLTVGFQRQSVPFHYHQKDFITDEIIDHYERQSST